MLMNTIGTLFLLCLVGLGSIYDTKGKKAFRLKENNF